MMEEAIEVIRKLWEGGYKSHRGRYYTVENARIYTLPAEAPPIMVAAGGTRAAELAGRVGNGLIGTSPQSERLQTFNAAGGTGKPRYGQLTVCWAEDEAEARRTAHEWWPSAAVKGDLGQELPLAMHFEQTSQMVTEEDVVQAIVWSPDPERHTQAIQQFVDAGYGHVYVHQVGPDRDGFFRFNESEAIPRFR